MKARIITQTFVACPNCGVGEHRVDHLFGSSMPSFGPWYCDECGRGFRGTINKDMAIDMEMLDGQKIATYDLLVLPPQTGPVFFIVEGMRFAGKSDDAAFYYEEHSCPTNFIRCEAIISDGDADPHGLFEFVKRVDKVGITDDAEHAFTEPFEGHGNSSDEIGTPHIAVDHT